MTFTGQRSSHEPFIHCFFDTATLVFCKTLKIFDITVIDRDVLWFRFLDR